MIDWLFVAFNGFLCAAAVFAAAHVPVGRRAAIILAAALFANWLLYVLAWTPFKPAALFDGLLSSKDLWAIMDGLCGMLAVAIAHRYWWGWAMWSAAVMQEFAHGAYLFGLVEFGGRGFLDLSTYSGALNTIFLAQVALFLLIGGRGIGDRIHHNLDRLRGVGRTMGTAKARSPRKGRS